MNLRKLLFLCLMLSINNIINADVLDKIKERDIKNTIQISYYYSYLFSLYVENEYLIVDSFQDRSDEQSIIAYNIQDNTIKLIVRNETRATAYRIFDLFNMRDRIDTHNVAVNDYYLVEIIYINDKLDVYCNRIININTNGFKFNKLNIGSNVNNLPYDGSISYDGGFILKKGLDAKIISMTKELKIVVYGISAYDYEYFVSINDRTLYINGWFLKFDNKIKLY